MKIAGYVLSGILATVFAAEAKGQQSIFGIPSSDVLDRGEVMVQFSGLFKPNNEEALRRFSSFVPGVVVGVGKSIEIGLNITGNVQPGTDATTLAPGVKWKFYEKKKLALFAGINFFIPVKNRAYKSGLTSYVGGSKSVGKARFTLGGFVSTRNVLAPDAIRSGGLFGFEYTVNKKITLAADWINGRHSAGFFTSGVIYKPLPKLSTNWGYSIGNTRFGRGNHFFLLAADYTFD
jgi:hypothetical protein